MDILYMFVVLCQSTDWASIRLKLASYENGVFSWQIDRSSSDRRKFE